MRTVAPFLLILFSTALFAQVECPSMGITHPKVKGSGKGSFMVKVGNGKGESKSDLFMRPVSARGKGMEKDAFATDRKKGGQFRDSDGFSISRKQSGTGANADFFATPRTKKSLIANGDHFLSTHGRTTKRNGGGGFGNPSYRSFINTEGSAFSNHSGVKGSGQSKGKDHFSRKQRRNMKKREPQPFEHYATPPSSPREPQMGLWGGTIGRRGREPNRGNAPLPKSEEKKESGEGK